ncbi:CHAP domain-containing protein [Pantoea cypripedii]|uniref:CHAP domain-containing protein n=1 Tax=Pantoea cypripedii TaxID=55209 RepID=UPI002FC81AC6
MERRELLKLALAGTVILGGVGKKAIAVPPGTGIDTPVVFPPDVPVPSLEEILDSLPTLQGVAQAYEEEIKKSKLIMDNCRNRTTPFEVAMYYWQLRSGEFNQQFGAEASSYAEEWPIRANPVIVQFFNATTLHKPVGDQTAWCAAFACTCIEKVAPGKSTKSAASSSYREWGESTTTPKCGDIVVFQHKTKPGLGHVGFYVAEAPGGVMVLGGNQMPLWKKLPGGTYESRNTGEVNIKLFPLDGHELKLHSYRTDPILHS